MTLKGKAHKYGDHVDTDVIIPARYLVTTDPNELAAHCMEGLDPDFAKRVRPGDVIVAGRNFGCGSSREHAPVAIKAAGISCVIADSFARIFYRNSFNIGLPIFESPEAAAGIEDGHEVQVDTDAGRITNLTTSAVFESHPLVGPVKELVQAGGLAPIVKRKLASKAG